MNFAKIYHHGYFAPEDRDILQYRHSEVIRENGFPVEPLLRWILCRTPAERETLLYLLKQHFVGLYDTYKDKIICRPSLPCFYNNGIFIKRVAIKDKVLVIEFNDPELRISKAEFPEVNITVNIDVIYKSTDGSILAASHGIQIFNYYNVRTCFYELKNDISYDVIRTTVHIDDAVMYENELNVKDILF